MNLIDKMRQDIAHTLTAITAAEQQQREKIHEEVAYLRKKLRNFNSRLPLELEVKPRLQQPVMVVCSSRNKCIKLWKSLLQQKPKWARTFTPSCKVRSRNNWLSIFRAMVLPHCMDPVASRCPRIHVLPLTKFPWRKLEYSWLMGLVKNWTAGAARHHLMQAFRAPWDFSHPLALWLMLSVQLH